MRIYFNKWWWSWKLRPLTESIRIVFTLAEKEKQTIKEWRKGYYKSVRKFRDMEFIVLSNNLHPNAGYQKAWNHGLANLDKIYTRG